MLKELYIENFAVIEKAVIAFDKGFNVFSGETGAGKSVLIGGINAVLGGRVSKDIVRSGCEKGVVTALFSFVSKSIYDAVVNLGYAEYGEDDDSGDDSHRELVLTREISKTGSSVARINGRAVTVSVLREVASGLVDVHGQHQTRLITSREVQLSLIDNFGGISLDEYKAVFREFSTISKKIKATQKEAQLKNEKLEILSSRLSDIKPHKLKLGEEEEVSKELNRLRNIQMITETLGASYFALNGGGESAGAVELVNLSKTNLGRVLNFIPECKDIKKRLDDVFIELDDIKHEIYPLISGDNDITKLSFYEERMSDFLKLKRKYNVSSIDELIEKTDEWQNEVMTLEESDTILGELFLKRKTLGDKVKSLAEEISIKRRKIADNLSLLIQSELDYLDMPGAKLVFDIHQDKVTISGMDEVEILISANRGETPKPLSKIASGGELSRIMLAIKVVLAKSDDFASMVFDEIDSGISGRAASKVGKKLSQLSRDRQVLCVTHLAQIAAMADNHLLIEKRVLNAAGDFGGSDNPDDMRTFTSIKRIEGEERRRELARIISGDDDDASLANAEHLLNKTRCE